MGGGGSDCSCDPLVLLPRGSVLRSGQSQETGSQSQERKCVKQGQQQLHTLPQIPAGEGGISGRLDINLTQREHSHDSSLGSAVQVDRTQGYWILCSKPRQHLCYFTVFYFCLFVFSRAALVAYGGSQARDPIGAVAASLRQSHSNTGSKPHLEQTPQLTTPMDPQQTE